MYVKEAKKITIEQALEGVLKYYEAHDKKIDMSYFELGQCCEHLVKFNNCVARGKGVFAICCKEPRGNLDTGHHHFDIFFIYDDEEHVFWPGGQFMKLLGATCNRKRNKHLRFYTWSSGAIGMSRLLASTDRIFRFLDEYCDGTYAQLDCR